MASEPYTQQTCHGADEMGDWQRFAILRHDYPFLHWDLLLEAGLVARTWRLLRPPLERELIAAESLPDHRLLYLQYEGPVSNNRGAVRREAAGEFRDALQGAEKGRQLLLRSLVDENLSGEGTVVVLMDLALRQCGARQRAQLLQTGDGRLFWWFS